MALAHLCKRLMIEEFVLSLKVKAFVVDHKARVGSSEEAFKVARWIKNMGRSISHCIRMRTTNYLRTCRT